MPEQKTRAKKKHTLRVCMLRNELICIIYKRMHDDLSSNDLILITFL